MIPTKLIQEKQNGPKAQLNKIFASAEAKGMPITHDGNTYHLQLRELDRTNWLGVRERIKLMSPTDSYTIMTEEDVPVTTTASQVDTWLLQALSYTEALYGARWGTKNALSQNPALDPQATFNQILQQLINN